MLKNSLDDSKRTLKKLRKRLFFNPKRVKNDPSKRHKWANFKSLNFGLICQPLALKIFQKVGYLSPKTMRTHFLKDSKKLRKSSQNAFFDPKTGQKWPLKNAKMSKFFIENFKFRGHLLTFRDEYIAKIRPFWAENNAQTLPKQR